MIDEGLWLVCYETGPSRHRINASCFVDIEVNKTQFDLYKGLLEQNIGFTVVITNMVRLGDLKEEK